MRYSQRAKRCLRFACCYALALREDTTRWTYTDTLAKSSSLLRQAYFLNATRSLRGRRHLKTGRLAGWAVACVGKQTRDVYRVARERFSFQGTGRAVSRAESPL